MPTDIGLIIADLTSFYDFRREVVVHVGAGGAELEEHMTKSAKSKTIDEYLAPLSKEKRIALEKLRRAIKSAAPRAEECISYQIPAFRLGGRMLVAFGAAANHCAFYPGALPVEAHKVELEAYDTSVGTIRYPADSPLPSTLVRKLVRTRIAERAARPVASDGARRRR